jgi:hypothetical protein
MIFLESWTEKKPHGSYEKVPVATKNKLQSDGFAQQLNYTFGIGNCRNVRIPKRHHSLVQQWYI